MNISKFFVKVIPYENYCENQYESFKKITFCIIVLLVPISGITSPLNGEEYLELCADYNAYGSDNGVEEAGKMACAMFIQGVQQGIVTGLAVNNVKAGKPQLCRKPGTTLLSFCKDCL